MTATKLRIDVETRSSVNLKTDGVYKYTESPDFRLLLFGYQLDQQPARVVDLANGEKIPDAVVRMIFDPTVEKWAFNAQFERLCLDRHFGCRTPLASWHCTSVLAATYGLPGNLRLCAAALKCNTQKMSEGEGLVRKFSIGPAVPFSGPDWQTFKDYCAGDVEAEREIYETLAQLPKIEVHREYVLDQRINDRGVRVDLNLAGHAVQFDDANKAEVMAEARRITGLDNPNSDVQLKRWLSEQLGEPITSLNKKDVDEIDTTGNRTAARVLVLRKQTSKASVSKFKAMLRTACRDGRLRGMFRFYGAQRTGRWSSKHVQLQNLIKKKFAGLDDARACVAAGDFDLMQLVYSDISGTLSALVRSALVPADGHEFAVADFSAIEARILSWLAGERWRLEVFAGDGKIYEAAAARMFKVPVETIGNPSELRDTGKIAELALGYGGGVGALINFGALDIGLKAYELPGLVRGWRSINPAIVKFWARVGNAAVAAVETRRAQAVKIPGGQLVFRVVEISAGRRWLFITLPSGRSLSYFDPVLMPGKFGSQDLTYRKFGGDDGAFGGNGGGSERVRSYGAMLVENITQAIARDCLAVGLDRCDAWAGDIVLHVHDEMVAEAPAGKGPAVLAEMLEQMKAPIPWAPDLLLSGEGFTCNFYRK